MRVSVNGDLCTYNYFNKPCVSVNICVPGTSTCQTINDILLDTGSYGFRVFKSVLSSPIQTALTPITVSGKNLAQCSQFADGSSDWGPVVSADLKLGSEPTVNVPIQLIDSTFASVPSGCGTPETSPSDAYFNGILGVGLFAYDCGSTCVTNSSNTLYYACSGTSCTSTAVALANQLQNPVSKFPVDNNGVILTLPSVASEGDYAVDGQLIFGIGTRSNNMPGAVTVFPASSSGYIYTTYNGTQYRSFIDSGSNANYFPNTNSSVLPLCTDANLTSFYCPTSLSSMTTTMRSYSGSVSKSVTLKVQNFDDFAYSNFVLSAETAGVMSGYFDWGLSFHFGKSVYVGIEDASSSLGTGPYWAY